MCIQPYTETTLRALQLRRRSHHYGLRFRVSQGSPEERRAQVEALEILNRPRMQTHMRWIMPPRSL